MHHEEPSMRRTTAGTPRPAEAGDGAATPDDAPIPPDVGDECKVFLDGAEHSPAERRRILAAWRDLFARIRREIDATPGGRAAWHDVSLSISIIPGRRTPEQDAAIGALLRRLIARGEVSGDTPDSTSPNAERDV
jgi:hypothetical protein